MSKATEFIKISERVISSKLHTESIFDTVTVESIQRILMDGTKRYVSDPKTFSKVTQKHVKQFVEHISEQLNKLPNFLHMHIHFDPQPVVTKKAPLFGEGAHSTFNEIMTISVNYAMKVKDWKDAWNGKFDLEIKRLRSVVRHELAHRLDLQKAHRDPVKRMGSRRFKKLMIPHKNSHSYYGMPTEILAHANHTVELINLGHDRGWRETVAQYALTDSSRNFKNTKRYAKTVAKLMVEYDVPWMKRIAFKRELMKLARQMRTSVNNLGADEVDKSINTALDTVDTEMSKSARLIAAYGSR
jgi:hypothetical protein